MTVSNVYINGRVAYARSSDVQYTKVPAVQRWSQGELLLYLKVRVKVLGYSLHPVILLCR